MAREKIQFDFSALNGKIKEKYGSIKKFSEAINSDQTYVSRKLKGHVDFTLSEVYIWSKALDIQNSIDYFFSKTVEKK